jgi:hypothetical protein
MPEAEERETWDAATFRVDNHMFALGSPQSEFVSIKATPDDQAGLMEMDPNTFTPAPYAGRFGWVRVRLAGVGPGLAQQLVTNAWERTAPRRLVSSRKPSGQKALRR